MIAALAAIVWLGLAAVAGAQQQEAAPPKEAAPPQEAAPPEEVAPREEAAPAQEPKEKTGEPEDSTATQRRVPGTHVLLARPDGFVISEHFPGYQALKGRAQIVITEFPRPYSEVRGDYADSALSRQGLRVDSREPVRVDGREGQLIVATHDAERDTRTWIAVFGGQYRSVVLRASCGERAEERLGPIFRETLLAARWKPQQQVDPFEGLDFVVRGNSLLRFSARLGNELLFTKDGRMKFDSPEDPVFVLSLEDAKTSEDERKRFCIRKLEEAEVLGERHVLAANPIEVDGLPGCEALAHGVEKATGKSIAVYEAALFGPRRTYEFRGRYGIRYQDPWLREYRAVVGGLRRR